MNFHELATIVQDIHTNHYKLQEDPTILPVISSNPSLDTYFTYLEKAIAPRKMNTINLYSVDYRYKHILGRFQNYGTYADIWVAAGLNNCWKRYVAAKELSHIIIDDKKTSMTTDIDTTVLWMIRDGMPVGVNDALDSEHLAAQFAAELLLPYRFTQPLLKDPAVHGLDIAEQFKVPLRIVQSMRFEKDYLEKRDAAYN